MRFVLSLQAALGHFAHLFMDDVRGTGRGSLAPPLADAGQLVVQIYADFDDFPALWTLCCGFRNRCSALSALCM